MCRPHATRMFALTCSVLWRFFVGEQNPVNLALMQWHVAEGTVDHDKPVAICLWVEAAEDATPRELLRTVQVGSNNALVKSAPLGIFRRGGIVKRMGVAQVHGFNSLPRSRGNLDGELSEARRVFAKAMLIPSRNGQSARAD